MKAKDIGVVLKQGPVGLRVAVREENVFAIMSEFDRKALRVFFIRIGFNSRTTSCFCRILQHSPVQTCSDINNALSKPAGTLKLKFAFCRCYVTYVQMVNGSK